MPSSTAVVSVWLTTAGTALELHTEHGQVVGEGVSEIEAVLDAPPSAAVTSTICGVIAAPEFTANFVVKVSDGTVTAAGTLRAALVLTIATERLVTDAAFNVIAQVPLLPGANDVGVHSNDVRVAAGSKLIEAVLELPFSPAVTVAV